MEEKKRIVFLGSENTKEGELLGHLQTFIDNTRGAKSKRDIRLGQTYTEDNFYIFKPAYLWEYFARKKYTIDKGLASKILIKEFNCENSLENTSGKGAGEENKSTRCLKVPINIMEKEYEIQDTELRQKERIY